MRSLLWLAFLFVVALCEPVEAVTNSLVVDGGNWNTAATWSLTRVPTNSDTVVITESNTVSATANPLNAYTGDLIIESNATLSMGNVQITTCMPSGTGNVFLYDGALIQGQRFGYDGNTMTVSNDFILSGDSAFTRSSYNCKVFFTGIWSGTGGVTFNCRTYANRDNDTYNFTGSSPNTYTGGTIIQSVSGVANLFYANADGCFGTGDVTVNSGIELRLNGSTTDAIDDTATLFLNGGGKLNLYGNSETVADLVVDGTPWPAGTLGRVGCPASPLYEVGFISGDGVLTVTNASVDVTAPTVAFETVSHSGSTTETLVTEPVTITITFSEPHTPALTSNDLENAETSGIEILSFMPASVAADNASYEVGLTATSSGLLQLGIKSSVTITDLSGNPLGHPAADNDTLTVKPLPLVGGELGILKPYVNGGINPATGTNWAKGDQYRLLFVTTGETNANSTDIEYYNSFVQGIAATSTNYPLLSTVTWKVIGSTDTVDARDNTGTNPTTNDIDVAVIALDGITLLAENNADLWDGDLANPPMYDQNGSAQSYGDVATGTDRYLDGIAVADGKVLGGSAEATPKVSYGRCTDSGTAWIQVYNGTAANPYPYYALSEPLTIVSTAPKGTLLLVK